MSEYQITYWRDIPSLVVARNDGDVTKAPLAARFQEAIDEAAMRLGDVDADAYLAGWRRSEWTAADEGPAQVADRVVADLEGTWPPEALTKYIENLSTSAASEQQ